MIGINLRDAGIVEEKQSFMCVITKSAEETSGR